MLCLRELDARRGLEPPRVNGVLSLGQDVRAGRIAKIVIVLWGCPSSRVCGGRAALSLLALCGQARRHALAYN